MPVAADLDPGALQRRVLRVLATGQVVGAAAYASSVTVGAFVVQDILGDDTPWSGIATAAGTLGSAVAAQALARRMRWAGRRIGMQLGYATAVSGGLLAALGAERGSLALFLVGLFLYGSGQAANLLARYAAADLATPEERARAMGRVVFASTFGAVFGPILIRPAEWVGEEAFGFYRYTGPWLFGTALFAVVGFNTFVRLRPDPLEVSGGLVTVAEAKATRIPVRDSLRTVMAIGPARLGLAAMMISQATMVAVMAMTPVHMKLHDHETLSQYVVSLHVAGMYAFAPLVGRFADQRGRQAAIGAGAMLLVGSTLLAAASGNQELVLFPALWGLGLGWNFGLIGGSSLLTESVPAERRVEVQGVADLMMSSCGALAGFASGFVRRAVGYHLLSTSATVLASLLLASVVASRRSARREPVGVGA